MKFVAILVGRRDLGGLSASALAAAQGAVKGGPPKWLADGLAAEFELEAASRTEADVQLRAVIENSPVDIAVVETAHRRKGLLVADMDSTIIGCECVDELADFAGLKAEVAAITEKAMRGELDFPEALRFRVALLKGLPLGDLQRTFDERVQLNAGARALVQTMRANGALTALVSGGFTFFTQRVAAVTGFAVNRANVLLDDGVALTGLVAEPILGREAKLAALLEFRVQHGLQPEETLAVGDGANDLAMIEASGLGVAYRAKPLVAAAAHAQANHADLTALLYFQGYTEADIITD